MITVLASQPVEELRGVYDDTEQDRPGRPSSYSLSLPPHWQAWWDSYELKLLGDFRQRATLVSYHTTLVQFGSHLARRGIVPALTRIEADHVRAWMAWLKEHLSPATASVRYRGLHGFFSWMVEEGEIEHHPMERVKPPEIPDRPVPVLHESDLLGLLNACEGTDFEARRDAALIRFLLDTGVVTARSADTPPRTAIAWR